MTLKEDEFHIKNAILVIENAVLEDRQYYNCTATNRATKYGNAGYEAAQEYTYVRVKGNNQPIPESFVVPFIRHNVTWTPSHQMILYLLIGTGNVILMHALFCLTGKLAALWPFLGICAEVFVLCAIILVYEKRRNKAEMDESDTDQSPEQ